MIHTVPLDELWRDRRFVNHLNEILRHCRIGKVRAKMRPLPFTPGQPFKGLPRAEPTTRRWVPDPMKQGPMFMDKCGCRVGSACGNVACPHRMVVTCGGISTPPIVPSHGVMM